MTHEAICAAVDHALVALLLMPHHGRSEGVRAHRDGYQRPPRGKERQVKIEVTITYSVSVVVEVLRGIPDSCAPFANTAATIVRGSGATRTYHTPRGSLTRTLVNFTAARIRPRRRGRRAMRSEAAGRSWLTPS
jgi:hypothetical protein